MRSAEVAELLRTPLYDFHVASGAKMVPFAGYAMPVQYPLGVLKEHLHTRASAGLFDVSHMGQVRISGPGCKEALESLLGADIIDLPVNMQRYGLFTNANGGIIDDLMMTNCGDSLLLVVNAARKEVDLAHLQACLPDHLSVELQADLSLLALQGPKARKVLSKLAPAVAELPFMHGLQVSIDGHSCWVSCSGYSGEDGFEISVHNDAAVALAQLLSADPAVECVGLGARDSLRLEAGLCLYGQDIDETTTPVEAALRWAIPAVRREGGQRAGGYPGADVVARQMTDGAARTRVMLLPGGRAPVRGGSVIVDENDNALGYVTSGGFGPSLGVPVAMAYVDSAALSKELFAVVRGKALPVKVAPRSLLPSRYYRGK